MCTFPVTEKIILLLLASIDAADGSKFPVGVIESGVSPHSPESPRQCEESLSLQGRQEFCLYGTTHYGED